MNAIAKYRPLGVVLQEPSARELRALRMLSSGIEPEQISRHCWRVVSSRGSTYRIRDGHCECPDNHPECKHALLVRFWQAHTEELVRRVGSDGTVAELELQYESQLASAANYQPPNDTMLTSFRLEAIDDDSVWRRRHGIQHIQDIRPIRRPWIARIEGLDIMYEFVRQFMRPKRDYRDANKRGNRGVWWYYLLLPGLYEVFELLSSYKDQRYFVRVNDLQITEVSKGDVLAEIVGDVPCPA